MKRVSIIILVALLSLILVSCSDKKIDDLTSINDYIAPSYTHKIETGTLTFAENVGQTAIITDYVGLYTAHEVTVPDTIAERTVSVIGQEAFYYCTSITKIELPSTITVIGDWAFAGCTSLETIVIPASVTSIGKGAFYGCTSLKSIVFEGEALVLVDDFAFGNCTELEAIDLPSSVSSLGVQAFLNCESLTSFTSPESLKSIGDMAFYGCGALNADGALVLNESITEIGKFAFTGINKEYITVPDGSYAAEYVAAMKATEETES